MPVLCRSLGLLFFCVPKTGSTAISKLLIDHYGGEWFPADHLLGRSSTNSLEMVMDRKHAWPQQLLDSETLTEGELSALYTFATTRNPFDWVVSKYLHERHIYRVQGEDSEVSWVQAYIERLRDANRMTFDEYVDHYFGKRQSSVAGAWNVGLNRLLRWESLESSIELVLSDVGEMLRAPLAPHNVTPGKLRDYRPYYSEASRRTISDCFHTDLERFGYEF